MIKAAELPASNVGDIPVAFRGRILHVAGDRTFDPWTVTIINDVDFGIRSAMERWSNASTIMSSILEKPIQTPIRVMLTYSNSVERFLKMVRQLSQF